MTLGWAVPSVVRLAASARRIQRLRLSASWPRRSWVWARLCSACRGQRMIFAQLAQIRSRAPPDTPARPGRTRPSERAAAPRSFRLCATTAAVSPKSPRRMASASRKSDSAAAYSFRRWCSVARRSSVSAVASLELPRSRRRWASASTQQRLRLVVLVLLQQRVAQAVHVLGDRQVRLAVQRPVLRQRVPQEPRWPARIVRGWCRRARARCGAGPAPPAGRRASSRPAGRPGRAARAR